MMIKILLHLWLFLSNHEADGDKISFTPWKLKLLISVTIEGSKENVRVFQPSMTGNIFKRCFLFILKVCQTYFKTVYPKIKIFQFFSELDELHCSRKSCEIPQNLRSISIYLHHPRLWNSSKLFIFHATYTFHSEGWDTSKGQLGFSCELQVHDRKTKQNRVHAS